MVETNVSIQLQTLRDDIDETNTQLVEILARRFALTRAVGLLKREHNLPIIDASRENDIYARQRALAREAGIDPDLVDHLFHAIIAAASAEQHALRGE